LGHSQNLIPNGNFAAGRPGALPPGWQLKTAHAAQAPSFKLVRRDGAPCLRAAGNGADDCFGYLSAPVTLQGGRTYRLYARFRISPEVNPQFNLRFSFYATNEGLFNHGIFSFRRLKNGWAEGEGRFLAPGGAEIPGEVRIVFTNSARGRVWIREISLTECAPIPPRSVRVAATRGRAGLAAWSKILDAAGKQRADLVLLPETFIVNAHESRRGPTASLLARKARQHRMYVAGGLYLRDHRRQRVYNTCLLFDRRGRLVGRYDKNHPYTPELWAPAGPAPGREVPVFKCDFGKVGILICYDSWFTDVAELLALKGAEIILFPNAGYFRGLMPARAADNGVRFVVSTLGRFVGIWDTAGRDVFDPEADPSNHAEVSPETTARDLVRLKIGELEMRVATLDLAQSPSPHNWGGPCLAAPGGRRNRREQVRLLHAEIQRELERWWEE
jgi:predicted amidohydrolase